MGIEYRILKREPEPGLPPRSTSGLRAGGGDLPYRAELAGGWLDQPFINRVRPGCVICAQLAPHAAFVRDSGGGLATSTRAYLAQLRAAGLRRMEPEALARMVFRLENGIDRVGHPVSGAQDALGLCVPGLSFQYYDNGYWPAQTRSVADEDTLRWLEGQLSLYALRSPRQPGFDPLRGHEPREDSIEALARSSELCKHAIEAQDSQALAESFALCRHAQGALFPAMYPAQVLEETGRLEAGGHVRGWKFTGCGGGGWLLLAGARGLPDAIPLRISTCNPSQNDE